MYNCVGPLHVNRASYSLPRRRSIIYYTLTLYTCTLVESYRNNINNNNNIYT